MALSITNFPSEILKLIISQWPAPSDDLAGQRAQARDLRNFCQTCKKLLKMMQVYLPLLKEGYSQNARIECKKMVGTLYPPLHNAVMADNVSLFKALLPIEDVNLQDKHGRTALHIATGIDHGKGRRCFVQLLLSHSGIDITLQYNGKTAEQLSQNAEIQALFPNS